jgi:(1->4)-alpha-D-glucan 1-alpha-D-glucosylmutase
VGGHPGSPAVSPDEFHVANRRRLEARPGELLATATHDTKRGEDARVRISVLSEVPDEWRRGVGEWMRINNRNRTRIHGAGAPDRNDEYLFYQSLLGVWPAEAEDAPIPAEAPVGLADRLSAYMQKAVREAKVHTSWIHEDQAYGRAVAHFVTRTLGGRTAPRFLAGFLPLQRRVARAGMINSLAQLVLKLASPGVPDFYQGTELWDLSLVDPDNRRPVDFGLRRTLLDAVGPLIDGIEGGRAAGEEVASLLAHWHDGTIKLHVTACGLRFRRAHQALMSRGRYAALAAEGDRADHVVAFARHDESGTLLAVVPRLVASLTTGGLLPVGVDGWGATRLVLPGTVASGTCRNVLTGERITGDGDTLPLSHVLTRCPVALLWCAAGDA